MAIIELYSTRQKKLRGELPDVYQYDLLPHQLKNQIVQIIKDSIGDRTIEHNFNSRSLTVSGKQYQSIRDILLKEYGRVSLRGKENPLNDIVEFFNSAENIEIQLDIIELAFKIIDKIIRHNFSEVRKCGATQRADDAINELNYRFKTAGVGYEFISGEIIRIDSQFIHNEVVKPALALLQEDACFEGAKDEFLSAHEHYRHTNYKESLVDCLKSFESCMKAICEKRQWPYKPTDTAKKLIETCLNNGLVPPYLQEKLTQLRCLLESGVPTIRNKEGGHGQGTDVKDVPQEMVSYTLHLTASNIVFLAECEKRLP